MLQGVERLVDLRGARECALTGNNLDQIIAGVKEGDIQRLRETDGHFSVTERDGQTIRLARTIGMPLRYFVAKMFHGPFLIVSDRIDTLFEWCREHKIGWQFDPRYTRMLPAHYLLEIDQIGCPDPAPRFKRFFDPPIETGSADIEELGANYIKAAYESIKTWILSLPMEEPIGIAFSGGIDSASVLLMARHALQVMGGDSERIRAFTLDLGGGKDVEQARSMADQLGFSSSWESVERDPSTVNLENAIRVIEDYHPLDVQCAAVGLSLLAGIRERYPSLRYMLDGDGGDENLKDYPLEDSDLTISSVLRNPLLYQEGWGTDAMKHSLTYSGGLSRAYTRTYAPAAHYGFDGFSPYTVRSAIAASTAIPFAKLADGSIERLYLLKAQVVKAGVKALTGIDMPISEKRRFQDGAGGDAQAYRRWRAGKGWCRQEFLKQWEERLRAAWDGDEERISGNEMSPPAPLH